MKISLGVTLMASILVAVACAPLSAGEEDGFKSIFNGKDLTGWDGNPKLWSVKDGAIVGETTKENPTKGNTFLIWKDGAPKDFELRLQFKLEGGNNSGIQYRSKDLGNWVAGGYQCDLNSGFPNMCKLYEEKGKRGRMCMAGEKVTSDAQGKKVITGATPDLEKLKTTEKKGDWNECVIIAKGNHIIQKLNGLVAVDVTDDDPTNRRMDGIVAIQIHAGAPMKISVKDIRLKELKD
jgi:hypothetical protein